MQSCLWNFLRPMKILSFSQCALVVVVVVVVVWEEEGGGGGGMGRAQSRALIAAWVGTSYSW